MLEISGSVGRRGAKGATNKVCAASAALVLVGGMLVTPPVAAQSGSEPTLPPQASTDCTGDVAVAVASDAQAQSDIYAAALLAASLATDCVVHVGGADRWATIARVGQAVAEQASGTDRTGTNDGAAAAGFTALTAGDSHWCGLRADGSIECWGSGGRSVVIR